MFELLVGGDCIAIVKFTLQIIVLYGMVWNWFIVDWITWDNVMFFIIWAALLVYS